MALQVIPKVVDRKTLKTLRVFQKVLHILITYFHSPKSSNKRGSLVSEKNFKRFKKEISAYKDVDFAKPIIDQIFRMQTNLIDKMRANKTVKSGIDINNLVKIGLQAWSTGDYQKIIQGTRPLVDALNVITTSKAKVLQNEINPFYIEGSWLFEVPGLLKKFEIGDIKHVSNIDLSKYRYSYLKLPESQLGEFQYLAYYMLHLVKDNSPVELNRQDLKNYFQMAYSDKGFAQLDKLASQYLSYNDKSSLEKLLTMIDQFPEISAANNAAKKKITTVYRGIPISEEQDEHGWTLDMITGRDKTATMLATTKSKQVASKFARMIGHLESDDERRSSSGVILTYSVDESAILLDTTILGGIFLEDEIIIDPRKATVIDSEIV